MNKAQDLLDKLWVDYTTLNPQALRIFRLIEEHGNTVSNDHIALRTYGHPLIAIDALAASFERFGYHAAGTYDFPEKHLFARHYEHDEPAHPKIFISQLKLDAFSPSLQETVDQLIGQIPRELIQRPDFPVVGRPWKLSSDTYEQLRRESEYAAWVAAFGFRANHFTVLVNDLKNFDTLETLNDFIQRNGYELNSAGGEIKGSPQAGLQQSSTLSEQVEVEFADGIHRIPACYYEFARRFKTADGSLFQGFVAKSADKIFESTDWRS